MMPLTQTLVLALALLSTPAALAQVALENGVGTISVPINTVDPCRTNQFDFPDSVPVGLNDDNDNVVLTISYSHSPKSSELIDESIEKMVRLQLDGKVVSEEHAITFKRTNADATETATVDFGRVGRFDTMMLSSPANSHASCEAEALSAPGITGYAELKLSFVIRVGDAGGVDSVVYVAYSQENGYENGFKDLQWSSHIERPSDGTLVWTPCEYGGIVFFNSNRKFKVAHVKELQFDLRMEAAMTMGVVLHNYGEEPSTYRSEHQFRQSTSQTYTVPVTENDNDVLFDQVRLEDRTNSKCKEEDDLPKVIIERVTIVGDSQLLTDLVDSYNGVKKVKSSSGSSGEEGNSPDSAGTSVSASSAAVIAAGAGAAMLAIF